MFGESVELKKRLTKIEELLKNGNGTDKLYERVKQLKQEKEDLDQKIRRHTFEVEMINRKHKLEIEETKNFLRKEMEKSLIESDLKRVEATAKLETVLAMDPKEERKHIQEMLAEAIKGLGASKVTIENKK